MRMSAVENFIIIRQTLAAPSGAVFDAWLTPSTMKRWMFVTGDNDIYKAQADVRVGGSYSVLEWTGCEHIDHFGQYREITRPHRLAFSLQAPKHFKGRTLITVSIERQAELALMTFHQTGIGPSVVEKPWRMMFDTLARILGDLRSAHSRGLTVEGAG
jgi:uncharacterized protein YndB with AHSA1/START domain